MIVQRSPPSLFRGPPRVFLTRPGDARSRCSTAAAFMVLGSSCESAPSASSQVASSRDGSLEVRRLHSARGPTDRDRVLPPDPIRLLGSSHLTACSRLGPADGSMSAALTRFPSRSFSPPGSVPVPRPMPSCSFAPVFLRLERALLQGLDPRTELPEVVDRPRAASSGFPSRVFSSTALAHGLRPGPSSRALSASSAFTGRRAALQSLA